MLSSLKNALEAATALGAPLPLGFSAAMLLENVGEERASTATKEDSDFAKELHAWLEEKAESGWGAGTPPDEQ